MKYILLLVLTGIFIACNDKDEDLPPTKTELITKSSWKYESGGVDQDKNGTIDINFSLTPLGKPCILDNTATFTLGGTGVADEGATKCDPAAPQTSPFIWSFNSSATEIYISGGLFGLGGQFKVVTLTDTRFSMAKDTSISLTGGIPQNISLIVNLQH
jgi:hypothetical protein